MQEGCCWISHVGDVDTSLAIDDFVCSVGHEHEVLLDVVRANQEKLSWIRIYIVLRLGILVVKSFDIYNLISEVNVNESQIGVASNSLPPLVVLSMWHERPIYHRINVDAIEAHGHIEGFIVLRRAEYLLENDHTVLTSHFVIVDICLR